MIAGRASRARMIVVRLISMRSRSRRPSGARSPLHLVAIKRLDPLLDAVMPQARRALFEVMAQLVAGLGGALAVEQRPYLGDHRSALGVLGVDGTDRRGPACRRRS